MRFLKVGMFLQDNRGIFLSSHSDMTYGITVTSGDDKSEPVDKIDPEPIPVDPEPIPVDPEPDPTPTDPEPDPTPTDPGSDPTPTDPTLKPDYGIFEQIIRWFQSLFG